MPFEQPYGLWKLSLIRRREYKADRATRLADHERQRAMQEAIEAGGSTLRDLAGPYDAIVRPPEEDLFRWGEGGSGTEQDRSS